MNRYIVLCFFIVISLCAKSQSSVKEIHSYTDEFAWNIIQNNGRDFFLNCGGLDNNVPIINIYKCSLNSLSCNGYTKLKNGEDITFSESIWDGVLKAEIIDSNKISLSVIDELFNSSKQITINLDSLNLILLSEIKVTKENIYLMGYVSKPNSPWDILLIRANHTLTRYEYFSPAVKGQSEFVFDVCDGDGEVFISTHSVNTDQKNYPGNELIQIDSNLTEIRNIWDEDLEMDGDINIYHRKSGQIIFTGANQYSINFNNYSEISSVLLSIKNDSLIFDSKVKVGKEKVRFHKAIFGSLMKGDYLYIVATGSFNPQNPFFQNADNEILLSKIKVGKDTLEEVWTKYYDFPGHYLYATGISAISDSSLLIHGSTYGYSDHPENLRNPFLMKVDLDGNLANYTTVEYPKSNNIGVYPNPTSNLLHFEIPAKEKSYRVKIIDLQGNMVLRKALPESGNLYVGELATGVYLYKIVDPEGKVISGKFLKE